MSPGKNVSKKDASRPTEGRKEGDVGIYSRGAAVERDNKKRNASQGDPPGRGKKMGRPMEKVRRGNVYSEPYRGGKRPFPRKRGEKYPGGRSHRSGDLKGRAGVR